jgi:hypothetical protein
MLGILNITRFSVFFFFAFPFKLFLNTSMIQLILLNQQYLSYCEFLLKPIFCFVLFNSMKCIVIVIIIALSARYYIWIINYNKINILVFYKYMSIIILNKLTKRMHKYSINKYTVMHPLGCTCILKLIFYFSQVNILW